MITRRTLLKSALAATASALVPSWMAREAKRAIDLSVFCGQIPGERYVMGKPFIQESNLELESFHRYGTNARICVRVPAHESDRHPLGVVKLPPAWRLDWTHDERRVWRPWPRADYRLASGSRCPQCEGRGVMHIDGECQTCQGVGTYFPEGFSRLTGHPCETCLGCGNAGPQCPTCKGNAIAVFPGLLPVGNWHVEAWLDRKMRTLGPVEYCSVLGRGSKTIHNCNPILFRFHGGEGLIMPVDRETALARLDV